MKSKLVDSPIGCLELLATDSALCGLNWAHQHARPQHRSNDSRFDGRSRILEQASEELQLYFEGKLQVFAVPVRPKARRFSDRSGRYSKPLAGEKR